VVGQWITETQARKLAADARLRATTESQTTPGRMTKDQISGMVSAITGLMTALRYASAADKAEIYAGLGLHLTCHPGPGPERSQHGPM